MTAAWKGWTRFWFAAADPTTMAFARVVTGLLVMYVHLAYCFDLTAFFGRDAWITLDTIDRERHEKPNYVIPFDKWEWEFRPPTAQLPDEMPQRKAVANWIRQLPLDDRAAVWKALRLVDAEGVVTGDPRKDYNANIIQTAMPYAAGLSTDPLVRGNTLKALRGDIPPGNNENFPPAFKDLPPEALKALTDDLEAFFVRLPPGDKPADVRNREFVTVYLREVSPPYFRANLLRFIDDLTKQPPDERERRIEYLEYWNSERRHADTVGVAIFSVWFHVSDPAEMVAVHVGVILVIVTFTLGLFTRVSSVLLWLCTASYLHRNQQVLFGQDTMMNILLIYLMVADSGGTLSLDRLIARYRAARHSVRRTGGIDAATRAFLAAPPPSVASGLAQRLLQVHFCFIYLASGLAKLQGAAWWNHNAIWDTMVNPEFTMIHYDWYQQLLRTTLRSRPVYAVVAAVGVGYTIFAEIAVPFLVWTRLRPYAVVVGCVLHAGIGVFMGLLVFSLMMMTMLTAYLPGAAIRAQLFGRPPARRFGFRYDGRDPKQARAAALLAAFDSTGSVDFTNAPDGAPVAFTLPDGTAYAGPAAFAAMARGVPGMGLPRMAGIVPGVSRAFAGG